MTKEKKSEIKAKNESEKKIIFFSLFLTSTMLSLSEFGDRLKTPFDEQAQIQIDVTKSGLERLRHMENEMIEFFRHQHRFPWATFTLYEEYAKSIVDGAQWFTVDWIICRASQRDDIQHKCNNCQWLDERDFTWRDFTRDAKRNDSVSVHTRKKTRIG